MPDLIDLRIEFLRRQAERQRAQRLQREADVYRFPSLCETAGLVLMTDAKG